jgi:hypothetical protein
MGIETKLELIDFEWSADGDFVFRNGDLGDTKISTGRGFIQEVEDRTKSSFSDWKLLPNKGANIEDFHGENNTEEVWKRVESAVGFSLTKDGFLDQQDFLVTVAPVSNDEIAVRIDFNTSLTDVIPDSKIVVKVTYDLLGQGPFMVR